jgi:hypothetical protein
MLLHLLFKVAVIACAAEQRAAKCSSHAEPLRDHLMTSSQYGVTDDGRCHLSFNVMATSRREVTISSRQRTTLVTSRSCAGSAVISAE